MQVYRVLLANLFFLSTSHAILIATAWSDLKPYDVDKRVDGNGNSIKGREILLTEETILNLTTAKDPIFEGQYYTGDLIFDNVNSLTLNVDIAQAEAGALTPIYWRKKTDDKIINSFTCGKYQDSNGSCVINLNVDATKTIVKHLVEMQASTLILAPNVLVTMTPNSKVHSLFVAGLHGSQNAEGTLEFTAGLKVDLRNTQGEFYDAQIGEKRRLIFENFGAAINVNPDKLPFSVQLYGDIYTEGLGTRINLVTSDSVFEGHIDIGNASFSSFTELTLRNGATADIVLKYLTPTNANIQSFALYLQDSTAKLEATLGQTQNAQTKFVLNNSTLYANFNYTAITRGGQDVMSINLDQSTWITNKSAYADEVSFGEGGGVIDMRFSDFNGAFRRYQQLTENNRIVLQSKNISGEEGIFRLYGILNRNLWIKDAQGNSIATDQIITNSLKGNHYIEIYWDTQNLDESLLKEDLVGDRIVVAQQLSKAQEGNFLGATTSLGLYEYALNLQKEDLLDNSGNHIGYEWVIGKLTQEGEILPSSPPRPSLLSKTLNSLFSVPYKTFLIQTQTLHQRMGDLRNFDNITGVYLRTNYSLLYSSQITQAISSYTHTEDFSLGADIGLYGFGGKYFFGASLNFTPMQDLGENDAYRGDTLAYGFSLYQTSLFNNGLYLDLLLKYAYATHQYDLYSQDLNGNSFGFDSHLFLSSFELGYKFKLPIKTPNPDLSFYYLNPQFNLDFGVILGSATFNLRHSGGYNLQAKYDLALPVRPSFSLNFGRRFDNPKIQGDVFVNMGVEYGFNAGNTLELTTPYNNGVFSPSGVLNLKVGAGGNVIFSNGIRLYFDLSSKFLGRISEVLNLNLGTRIPLGEKRARTLPYSSQTPIIYGNTR